MRGLLQGRVALITGGSRGIGFAIAKAYLQEGAKVVICAREEARLRQATAELEPMGDVFALVCDVSMIDRVKEMVRKSLDRYGRLDILVNNAGISMTFGRVGEIDPTRWAYVVGVNLIGTFNCCHEVIPNMLAQGGGKIINLKGYGAHMPSPRVSAYGASKAAIVAFTRTLAREYRGTGITANCLSPGLIRTELVLNREATEEGRPHLERFEHVFSLLSNPVELPAALAVRMAASAADGVSGKEFRALSRMQLIWRLVRIALKRRR